MSNRYRGKCNVLDENRGSAWNPTSLLSNALQGIPLAHCVWPHSQCSCGARTACNQWPAGPRCHLLQHAAALQVCALTLLVA